MAPDISLRALQKSDLPIFFEQQLEPDAIRMAAFPPRDRDAFMAHWAKIKADGTTLVRTIVFADRVAGNIVLWEQDGRRNVGYWLGKEFWGKGIASAALARFVEDVKARPLYAHVAITNAASIRVLQKCGFILSGKEIFRGLDGEPETEFIMTLEA